MSEFSGPLLLADVPDNLTIPQFFLDSNHPTKPVRRNGIPWFVDDKSGRKVGFEEVRAHTIALANSLRSRFGIDEDEVVLIFSPNHIDYPIVMWATHRLGAIVSGANPMYTAQELIYQLETTKASLVVTYEPSLDIALSAARAVGLPENRVLLFDDSTGGDRITIKQLIAEGLAQDLCFVERKLNPGENKTKVAFLNFSSGTTGKPKAVLIPHYGIISHSIQMALHHNVNKDYCPWEDHRFRPGDICAGLSPFYHIYGLLLSVHFMMFCGLTLVVIPKFNFIDFLKSVQTYKMTHLLLVPPQILLLCKHPAVKDYDLSHVRFMLSGAAPLSAELMDQLVRVLPNAQIGQGYGLTESPTSGANFTPDQKLGVPGSVGKLLPGVVARVVKADGTLARPNEPGELVFKMPYLALGYLNNEQATKETFVDGWLRTGDEVVIDDNGEVFIVDRLKEILKVRGFQVAPAELEGCLLDHPDVTDTCVVGVPDEYSGELPLAFVVLHPDAAKRAAADLAEAGRIKASIIKHVADNKVAYKRLAGGIEFTDVIPKNPSGKLLRRVLRDRARNMRARPTAKL